MGCFVEVQFCTFRKVKTKQKLSDLGLAASQAAVTEASKNKFKNFIRTK